MQWGEAYVGNDFDNKYISFPIPFPHICLNAQVSSNGHIYQKDYNDYSYGINHYTNSYVSVSGQCSGGYINYIAIGY